MRHLYMIVAVLMLSVFSACDSGLEEKTSQLSAYLELISGESQALDHKVYVIIPLQGCSPCIDKTIQFTKAHLDNSQLGVIVSNVGEKEISFKYTKEQMRQNNFWVDDQARSFNLSLTLNNPSVYFVENGKIVKYLHLQPQDVDKTLAEIQNYIS